MTLARGSVLKSCGWLQKPTKRLRSRRLAIKWPEPIAGLGPETYNMKQLDIVDSLDHVEIEWPEPIPGLGPDTYNMRPSPALPELIHWKDETMPSMSGIPPALPALR